MDLSPYEIALIAGGFTITGTLVGSLVGYRLSLVLAATNEKRNAASKFKSSVIYELSGFFPIDQHWEKKEFHRIYNSISRINSAAAEFRYFVTRKYDFDKAVNEYNKYCRETTHDSVAADTMYPDMRKEGVVGKREQFKNLVEHLLSFAEKNK